ncbi:hypothetical protein BCEP4_790009 [Burkholderia cepacia]|nr:hypothetical protein BCEP4_790009 [Burkholderia cepacia]
MKSPHETPPKSRGALSETTARTIIGRTTPAIMTSAVGLPIGRHDFSRLSIRTRRTANYLKSFSSIGKKRTKSMASFIVGMCADHANVLSLCAISIINLRKCILLRIIAYIEIPALESY